MANRTNIEENIRIGHLLQNARESHGLTQQDLCKAADLSKNQISAVERGASKASVQMLLGYCSKIGVTPNDILGYSGNSNILPELQTVLSQMDESQQRRLLNFILSMQK